MLTQKERDGAREICERATEGPWFVDEIYGCWIISSTKENDPIFTDILSRDNCEFIATARTGWPRALEEIERLRGVIADAFDYADQGDCADELRDLLGGELEKGGE